MQQPLAHLYFYITLEHLIPSFNKKKISSMLEFVAAIEKVSIHASGVYA